MKHEKDVSEELGRLPHTLRESYDIIYEQIKSAGSTSRFLVETAMKWLLCAQRPLKPLEFIAAVSINSEGQCIPLTVPQLLDMCCNMVVLDEEIETFRFAHLSVREYLEGRGDYTKIEIHTLALDRCVDSYISELRLQTKLAIDQNNIFRPYATLYWPVHCQTVGNDQLGGRAKDKVRQFLFQGCSTAPSFTKWTLAAKGLSRLLRFNYPQKDILEAASSSPPTPLFVACCFGLLWIIHELSSFENSCWDQQNDDGSPALNLAARWGHLEVVKLLLKKEGVEVNTKDNYYQTPLSYAVENRHLEVVKLLLEKEGVEVNPEDIHGQTPLSYAVENGQVEVVKLLLEKEGVEVNSKDRYSRTPLSCAVDSGHLEVVKLLLEKEGVEINTKDWTSRTPLSWAAENGHLEMVKLLLEKEGVEINTKDWTGCTPLSWAAENGHLEVVKLLLKEGVEINTKDWTGGTPLSWAAGNGHLEMVNLLTAATLS
jgi:ankyrin repeat protein